MTVILIVNGVLGIVTSAFTQGVLGNKRTSVDHPNYRIIEISQNTEKSSGDLCRLAVIQTAVKNHRLSMM